MATGESAAPGWYADPYGRYKQRYWDGSEWTGHVEGDGSATPAAGAATPSNTAYSPASAEDQSATTTCPNGHATRGDQKFCGECGSPLDAEAPTTSATPAAPPGWYPEPSAGELRYWDGEQWLDIPAPSVAGSTSNVPAVSATSTEQGLVFDPATDTFTGSLPQIMRLAVRAVESQRWTVVSANDTLGLLTFETKMSMGSWSGATCTLSFHEMRPGAWQVSGSGKQNVRGGQLIAMDFGEAKRKAERVIAVMKQLAQGQIPSQAPVAGAESSKPDWYPDPARRYQYRYWDGEAWTKRVRNGEKEKTDRLKPPR